MLTAVIRFFFWTLIILFQLIVNGMVLVQCKWKPRIKCIF